MVLPDDHSLLPLRRRAFARALAEVRTVAPRVVVSAQRTLDDPLRAERIASAGASAIVVAGPAPEVDRLIMSAYCPVVVVPAQSTPCDGGPPIVLAAGPATGPEVIDFAFDAAAARRTDLLAVRTWSDPVVDLGRLDPGAIGRWDEADARVRRDLAEQLSAGIVAYPSARVDTRVVNDRCVDLLAAFAGGPTCSCWADHPHGAVRNCVRPSPALVLARRVPCPVAVVPPPGPPRHP